MTSSYVCVDLETTGLHPKNDRIIEVGAVKVINGVQTDTFTTLVNPGRSLEECIVKLTGIEDKDLKEAPDISEVMPKLLDFIGDLCLLGHSVLFDFSFLKKAAVNQNLTFEKTGIDTLKIARKYLSNLKSRRLGYLCQYYHIPHKAHRALEDAISTCALYKQLAEQFETQENAEDFLPRPLLFQVKKESPITKPQKEQLYKLIERHTLDMNCEIDKLTRSEASRYIDRILAKYGR